MSAPRLEVDLEKIRHNASALVSKLGGHGISVTGVTKACLGEPRVAKTLLAAGVKGLGDSRIENIEAMRRAGIAAPMTLIRSPMPSQAARVVAHADISFNTELDVIAALSSAARRAGKRHGVVLMVEMGDLREGIMPGDLQDTVRAALRFPNIDLKGIGTNLACQSGVSPDTRNMSELSRLADLLDADFGLVTRVVSGGNSSNLKWALSGEKAGRVNDLRLGESILLGLDPLDRLPIEGLYTDAISLVAEVIETKTKPFRPWGTIAQAAFGGTPLSANDGSASRTILALGRQDIDPLGLTAEPGIRVLGASSDHLVVDAGTCHVTAGSEMTFQLNYSALLRAMTSPFVTKTYSLPAGQGAFESRRAPGPRSSEEPHQWH
ncbi:alanine/ornithine racemase family PLP-dependent enzyme [Roseibium marinum]|uniref:Putative amino acid racemase n=1 Tax=Roseibium marinum TaxID=281252 RepID=A0A2S3UWN1_9HYPH|nr:alanine/ornithine racemase family PLP-dependent enzyme [Roseibium marinum]POF32117.1 putative amino acid racemase [Roseibium marinum]